MSNMRNEYIASEIIVNAAKALALRVFHERKPIIFNMDDYVEVLFGVGLRQPPAELKKIFEDSEEGGIIPVSPEEYKGLMSLVNEGEAFSAKKKQIVEALSDAFSITEVYSIQPCLLVEIGSCCNYEDPRLKDSAHVYLVIAEPPVEECVILDL